MIKLLLNYSINSIDRFDKLGNTALIYAIKYGNPKIISILLINGYASVNVCNKKTGESPLIIAIQLNLISIIKLLIRAGVKLNFGVNPGGVKSGGVYPIGSRVTPLCLAVMNNHTEIVNLLMNSDCNMTITCDINSIKNYNNYITNNSSHTNNHVNHKIHKHMNNDGNDMHTNKSNDALRSDVSAFISPFEIAKQNRNNKIIELFENKTRRM